MPSKKKKYSARFPPARIKKIMQTDEEVGKVAAAVPVVISRALELFIESLILQTSNTTKERNAKTMTTQHIKQVILAEQKFDFLKELVNNIPDVQQSEEGQDGSGGSGTAGRSTPDIDKPRKKRGRPRKAADAPDDGTGGPTRPKRGRPPKKKVQEPEAGSSEEESATEENDTETGDEEDDEENEDEDDDSNHRNHDNHTGGSTGSGGDFTPGGAPPPGTDGATGSGGETGNNTQPAGLPFAGYTLPTTVSPQNPPAVVGNQGNPSATFSTAQASEIPPLVSGAPAPPGGSINNTVDAEKAQVSNSTVVPENDASRAGDCATSDLPTEKPVNSATNLTTSSTTETDRNSPSTVSTTATSASQPNPIMSVKSNTCPENSNDSNSKETANDSRKSPVTVPNSNATPDSKGDTATATSVSDSVANGATSVSGADTKEATTALTSATTTVTSSAATDKKQQDKSSALKEDEDSNHSSDSEVAAQVGSQAMNMIMSGYDPEKAQSVAASAAMNMIKDQYNNKLVDLKLSSSSATSRTSTVSIVNSETKPKIESTVTNHSIANMVKHEPQSTKGLLSSPGGPPTSESVPSFVKKEELDLKHVNMLEGGARAPLGQGPPPLVPTKKEEPPSKEDSREEEPMDMNTDQRSPAASPVQNHASPSPHEGSPKPGTPSAYSLYERPSSSGLLQANSIAVSSPSAMEKSQWSHLTAAAGAPYGLLGAYRPMIPGMAGMQFARMPTMMNQHMMAAPAGLYAHPGLVAAGHPGLQLQGASAMQAAVPSHLASAYAMAGGVGGVRYAAAPPAAAYMQAAMMPAMHAATGPYSHLGVPGQDAYLAALGMGVGIQPAAAAAQFANPSAAATALYPQLQLAQAQAQAQLSQAQAQAQAQATPQYAMYSQPRGVPYQGFLPRPPT